MANKQSGLDTSRYGGDKPNLATEANADLMPGGKDPTTGEMPGGKDPTTGEPISTGPNAAGIVEKSAPDRKVLLTAYDNAAIAAMERAGIKSPSLISRTGTPSMDDMSLDMQVIEARLNMLQAQFSALCNQYFRGFLEPYNEPVIITDDDGVPVVFSA